MSARLVPTEGCEEACLMILPWLLVVGLLEISGVPWLIEVSFPPLPSSSHGVLPVCLPLCPNFSLWFFLTVALAN